MENGSLRVALVVLASPETHEGLGRVVNGLRLARELRENGDDVVLVFDGAGTVAAAAALDPEQPMSRLFAIVRDRVVGACAFCAGALGVQEFLEASGIPLLAEFHQHPSLRHWLRAGYRMVTC
ncbi:MAG: DsrE family protein [Thermomicrobium sp.]|nr:DsrE family protein [Thermomicrobium sp.]